MQLLEEWTLNRKSRCGMEEAVVAVGSRSNPSVVGVGSFFADCPFVVAKSSC